jgi:4-amino-4-deoxy-L-arabinose transferase
LRFPCPDCGKRLQCRAELAGRKVKCPCGRVLLAPRDEPAIPPPAPLWRRPLLPLVLASVLVSTFVLKLHNLGHTALTQWDEAYHAVVARNVLKHPLRPTLVDTPYLPYEGKKWKDGHVWLHKPILPFWQVGLCFAFLGVNTFALRLPAAVLSTAAALLTYLIGKELFDRRTALIAAALQAANPFLVTLVHGYQFADNVDVALLFWVEVGVYFLVRALRTGSWRDVLLAGLAQGLAFLCKSYLAAIVLGIALAAWLLPLCRLARREDCRIGPFRILGMVGVTLLTVTPWVIYSATEYPKEFWQEHAQVWRHLYANVEGWGAPWDRLVFDYLIAIYGVFYTPILVAVVVLLGRAVTRRHAGLWLAYAWGLGVVLPHLFAVSKTPSATVIALPAFLLLAGHLISEAWRGERWPLAALTAVLAVSLLFPAVVKNPGYGFPNTRAFGGVMRRSLWVLGHVGGALALAAVLVAAGEIIRRLAPGAPGRYIRAGARVFCLGALVWLGVQTVQSAWRVTNANVNDPAWLDVGEFARDHLPENAVLFCEERTGSEHLTAMFYADRTCYALERDPDVMARQILGAGGIPYVVSHRRLPLPPVHASGRQGPTVYLWQPP